MTQFDATAEFEDTIPQLLTGPGPWTVMLPPTGDYGFIYGPGETIRPEHEEPEVVWAHGHSADEIIADLNSFLF